MNKHFLCPLFAAAVAVLSAHSVASAQATAQLHVVDSDSPEVFVERDAGTVQEKNLFRLLNNGTANFEIASGAAVAKRWSFGTLGNGDLRFNAVGSGAVEVRINRAGDMDVRGQVICGGGCVNPSSRELKTDFALVDEEDILERLTSLPMRTWRYKGSADTPTHMGPVAEEFHEVFGLSDSTQISTIDVNGVTMAAVKGLNKKLERKEQELAALQAENAEFALRLAALERELAKRE